MTVALPLVLNKDILAHMQYDHREIEPKWQKRWEAERAFDAPVADGRDTFYALVMFPYPSGAGLHVGHPLSYTAVDVIARKRRMEGQAVLHPMGWDAFGLPAENYAIRTGVSPVETTRKSIETFRKQIRSLGLSYDWTREVNTSAPDYYRWTQWLFLELYRKGLAYKATAPVNWCDSCQTVLANEQVVDGKCERCGNAVRQKELSQWFLRITAYADRLLEGLAGLDWPEKIVAAQRNWLGRSEGTEVNFRGIVEHEEGNRVRVEEFDLPVFTTRPDTLFGVTYLVLAPEHPLVGKLVSPKERRAVEEYVRAARGKSERERTGTDLEKTGVFIGAAAVHPLTGDTIPVWIADYVLPRYGTGAVMGVPAHDERDWEFAKRNGCEVNFVVAPPHDIPVELGRPYTAPGVLVHSDEWNGLTSADAAVKITDALEAKKLGRRVIHWHLRDWLISRQRYWGAPIPIIYCDECGTVPVPERDLPVKLPDDVDFKPTGESPLVRSKRFHDVACPHCGKPARRESDTMDTFVDSSWYYLRYTDPKNAMRFADPAALTRWCPVDLYVGGAEHAVLHLLYVRFIALALHDLGHVTFTEPFPHFRTQGLILGENGEKMSKSKGNVVNPDDIVRELGADSLRLYVLFMGPLEDSKPWSTSSIVGVRRFLDRVAALVDRHDESSAAGDPALTRLMHQTVRKVSDDIEALKFNTAISQLMIFLNGLEKRASNPPEAMRTFVRLLSPFAPHLAEELWERMGTQTLIAREGWPAHDASLAAEDEVTLVVQLNGKVRDRITVEAGLPDAELQRRALALPKVRDLLTGQRVSKVVVAKGTLVNIVTG